MWDIPFNKTFNPLRLEDIIKITDILQYHVVKGPYIQQLEDVFSNMFNVKHCIACANATSGLELSVEYFTSNIISNPKVVMPSFTWWSTWKAVQHLDVHMCDIDKDAWIMNEFDEDADLVISVDVFGNKSYIKTNIPVIYDAAHGFGLSELGHRGLIEVVSFSFTKIVQGMQGGMILTNDESAGAVLRNMVNYYAKMTEIEAFMTLKSLESFPERQMERIEIIDFYRNNITVPFVEQLIPYETNYSVYAILFKTRAIRDKICKALNDNGIEDKRYYVPIMPGCRNADNIFSRILALPIYHNVEKERVCEVINKCG